MKIILNNNNNNNNSYELCDVSMPLVYYGRFNCSFRRIFSFAFSSLA